MMKIDGAVCTNGSHQKSKDGSTYHCIHRMMEVPERGISCVENLERMQGVPVYRDVQT